MAFVESFDCQVDERTRVLVLGSMPSVKSLAAAEYYAHPRNAFWPLMQAMHLVDSSLPYQARIRQLNAGGVGLWDVYRRCFRPGSLDAAIKKNTAEYNPIDELVAAFPGIVCLAFNGQAAEKGFKRYLSTIDNPDFLNNKKLLSLPSTSPANAMLDFDQKLRRWQQITGFQISG